MCTHCSGVRRRDIISVVNSSRTPSEFSGPEKRDGEVSPDITSVSGDPFSPMEVRGGVTPLAHRLREFCLWRHQVESDV